MSRDGLALQSGPACRLPPRIPVRLGALPQRSLDLQPRAFGLQAPRCDRAFDLLLDSKVAHEDFKGHPNVVERLHDLAFEAGPLHAFLRRGSISGANYPDRARLSHIFELARQLGRVSPARVDLSCHTRRRCRTAKTYWIFVRRRSKLFGHTQDQLPKRGQLGVLWIVLPPSWLALVVLFAALCRAAAKGDHAPATDLLAIRRVQLASVDATGAAHFPPRGRPSPARSRRMGTYPSRPHPAAARARWTWG